MHVFMNRLEALQGWKRRGALYLLGACATLTLPPFFLLPLAIPAYGGLAWLIWRAPSRKIAFTTGWWWGFGFFTSGLYWMCIALLTDPVKFAWLIPFTLLGLHGALALFSALAALILYLLWPKREGTPGLLFALCFTSVWSLIEFARGHILTGFPWNLPGYAFALHDTLLQSASIIGIYGLTFLILYLSVCVMAGRRAIALGIVLALLHTGFGIWRLNNAPAIDSAENVDISVPIRIVQANILQHHKWNPEKQLEGLKSYSQLSQSPGHEKMKLTVWPETAVPYVLNDHPSLLKLLAITAPEKGALLTGALRSTPPSEPFRIWNSLHVITRAGLATVYDKHHLVPFGEFVPLRSILPIDKITPGATDFSRGPGPTTLTLPEGLPTISPLICYEAIFPGEAFDAAARPDLLVNITNDAWFGISTGPYQHFHMSRVRAVETGIPLLRAANTGISGVIDAYGRVLAKLPLAEKGVINHATPRKIEKTPYSCISIIYLLLLSALPLILTFFYHIKLFFNKSRLRCAG